MINRNNNINYEIPDNIRDYFNESGVNIDEVFSNIDLENIIEESSNTDIHRLAQVLKNIERNSNQHKILLGTVLLELRSQVKKNQKQLTDLRKQSEYENKEISRKLTYDVKSLNSLNKEISNFYNKFSLYLKSIFQNFTNEVIKLKKENIDFKNKISNIDKKISDLENLNKDLLKNTELILKSIRVRK